MAIEAGALETLQHRYGAMLEREIDGWLSRVAPEPEFPGMMRYQMGTVDEGLAPTGSTGGKRFRPLLCLLSAEACGGSVEVAVTLAAGIEILHNFSLVHDDIEDRDPERRHRPTLWKVWGEAQAINAGDAMLALAFRSVLALNLDPPARLDLVQSFGEMSLALTRGQYLDMSFETRNDVTADEYLSMIALKSGAIIAFSTWAGARIAGAPGETRDALRSYGEHLGRAFQIEDDILGIWGLPEKTGKEPATDIRNRKKTLPVLLALEQVEGLDARALHQFYRGESEDLDPVLRLLDGLGIQDQAAAAVEQHRAIALDELERAALTSIGREQLTLLAREITGG